MNAVLKIGTIICWAIGIGCEYLIQKWPTRKRLLNTIAALGFLFALSGEYASYRYDEIRESKMEEKIDAQGIPATAWFQARDDGNAQTFTIPFDPLVGSMAVLVNGLQEPVHAYSVHGRNVTVFMKLGLTDSIIIEYRHKL